MKNIFKAHIAPLCVIALAALIGFSMTACEGPVGDPGPSGNAGQPGLNSYVVIFNSNGGTPALDALGVSQGGKVDEPADPSMSGYEFGGWYTDYGTFNDMWDFNKPVIKSVTLYAKWFTSPPADLLGTWTATTPYGEEKYIITATTFTSLWEGETSYMGSIVNHRADGGATQGYITIRYTVGPPWYPGSDGNYYVIHYKSLTASAISLSASSDGVGKSTPEEAEIEYTVGNSYFADYSDLTEQL